MFFPISSVSMAIAHLSITALFWWCRFHPLTKAYQSWCVGTAGGNCGHHERFWTFLWWWSQKDPRCKWDNIKSKSNFNFTCTIIIIIRILNLQFNFTYHYCTLQWIHHYSWLILFLRSKQNPYKVVLFAELKLKDYPHSPWTPLTACIQYGVVFVDWNGGWILS